MEKTDKENTAMRDHIKRRITRKPNRVIKRSFIESAMCNHNIVILLMGMLVFLGIMGLALMPKQEMPQFTVRQGACVVFIPAPLPKRWSSAWQSHWRTSSSATRR